MTGHDEDTAPVQRRIYANQNPRHCEGRNFFLFSLNSFGMGSDLHTIGEHINKKPNKWSGGKIGEVYCCDSVVDFSMVINISSISTKPGPSLALAIEHNRTLLYHPSKYDSG